MVTEQAPSQTEGTESPAAEVVESPPPAVEDDTPIVDIPAPEEAGAPDADAGGAKPEGDGAAEAEKPAATETESEVADTEAKPEGDEPRVYSAEEVATIQKTLDQRASDAEKASAESEAKATAAEQRAEATAQESREASAILKVSAELRDRYMNDPTNPLDEAAATARATAEVGNEYKTFLLERELESANAKVAAAEQGNATTQMQAIALSITDKLGIDDPVDRGRVLAMGTREAMQDMAQIIVDAKTHRASQTETKEAVVEAGGPTNTFDGGGGTGTTAPMTDEQIVAAYGDPDGSFNDNKAYNAAIGRLGWA